MTIRSWTATELCVSERDYDYIIENVPRDVYDRCANAEKYGRSAWPLLKGYEYRRVLADEN